MSFRVALLTSAVLWAGALLYGQSSGTLTGAVQDPGGAAVPNATVQLFLKGGTAAALSSTTNHEGLFNIPGIRPENYEVRVEAPGFAKYVLPGVVIDAARQTSLPPIKLEVGSVATVVEVGSNVESVQTSNIEVSSTVSMTQVDKLPVLNRSPLALIGTQAGVFFTTQDNTTINGQRTTFTNVTMNGVNIQDNFIRTNALDFLPNLLLMGQVAEMTVSSSNMDASQSGASAVTFVTPSGGNSYHGNAYWSNRNNFFAANTWFNNQSRIVRPFLNQNQIGGTIGGHVIKNKWFYYVNYEAFRLRQSTAFTTTIPTADARNGIFTYLVNGVPQKVNILAAAGVSINPAVSQVLSKVPSPSNINTFNLGDSSAAVLRNTGGYAFLGRNNRTRDNITGTTDYILSSKQNFNVTFNWNRDILDRPDQQNDYSLIPKVTNNDVTKLFTAAWRTTPTANITNELRGGFNLAPSIFDTSETFPSAIVTGFVWSNPLNTFRAQGRQTNTYNLNDNLSWVKGKHFLKFGFAYQDISTAPYNDGGITPTYTIGLGTGHQGLVTAQLPGASASDLAAANNLLASLAGYVTSSTQTFNVTSATSGFVSGATNLRHFKYDNYAFYIQDNWKLRNNLTLEAGLRYEYYAPLRETDNLELVPDLTSNSPVATLFNPNASFNFVKGGFYNGDKTDFGPRIGLAWDVKGDGKTSIRLGYGIYYGNDQVITTVRNNAETNPGLTSSATASGLTSSADNPTAVKVPTFKVPRTLVDNYALSTTGAMGLVNPGLKTPYVGQWSLSVQREIKGMIIEGRYVGNHGTKLLRGVDYNQVNIKAGGLLDDFKRAQSNAYLSQAQGKGFVAAYNPAVTGSQQLTLFPTMPNGGYLTNSSVLGYLQTSAVGSLAEFYQINGVNGNINFFPNPNIEGANYITNGADSTYNSLQLEVRRRFNKGFTFQANYNYSKVLSNSLGDAQTNFEPLLDNGSPQAERAPAPFDMRHVFKANGVYELPFGPGHKYNPKALSRVIGGWSFGTLLTKQSGGPFSITSGSRGTLNRSGRSTYNTVVPLASGNALTDLIGFRMTPTGPYYVAASDIGSDGRATAPDGSAPFAGQLFANPAAGTIGSLQRRSFYGPGAFGEDFSLSKDTKIFETHVIQLRMDAANIFNHPTFTIADQSINSTTFGKITATNANFGRRLIQFQLTYKF